MQREEHYEKHSNLYSGNLNSNRGMAVGEAQRGIHKRADALVVVLAGTVLVVIYALPVFAKGDRTDRGACFDMQDARHGFTLCFTMAQWLRTP